MKSHEVIEYITRLEQDNERLATELARKQENTIDALRYYSVALTTGEVARLHGVSRSRIIEYAKRHIITLHPDSTDSRLLFRASDVLTWDFNELKRQYRGR